MLQPLIDSFHFFRNNLERILTLLIAFAIISKIIELAITNFLPESATAVTGALFQILFSFLLNAIFQCTFIVMLIKITKNQRVSILQCLSEAIPFMLLYILGSIIVNTIVLIGLVILLVLPGLYAYARLAFFDFAIVIKSENPFEAIKTSWQMTSGAALKILLNLLPLSVAMLALMVLFTLIDERTLIIDVLGSFVFWIFGAFWILLRYRLYLMLSDPKGS